MKPPLRTLMRYALPLAAITALTLYVVARRDDRLHYELPTLPPMEVAAVDRVEIKRGETLITIQRSDQGWLIEGPRYAAEPTIINNMVRVAANLTLTDLIAREPTYRRYGLGNAEGITATFREGARTLRVLKIGKRAPTYSHTFVMIGDDPRVYQAVGDLTRAFTAQEQALRDRTILQFETDEISAITVTTSNGTFELQRQLPLTPDASPTWTNASGAAHDATAIAAALNQLAGMQATRFTDQAPKSLPLLEIELHGIEESRHRLTIYPKTANAHVATSSDADGPFVLLPVILMDVLATFSTETD